MIFGVLVVTRVLSTNTKCTRDRGCIVRPAFPTPSLGERFINASGAWRGEVVNVRLVVIASAAKQSISPRKGRMDCFAALAMTVRWTEGIGQCAQTVGHSVWVPAFAGTTAVLAFTHTPIRLAPLIFRTACRY